MPNVYREGKIAYERKAVARRKAEMAKKVPKIVECVEKGIPYEEGRPTKKTIEEQVYELARLQCTLKEMAALTGIAPDQILNSYGPIIEKGNADCNQSLRRRQLRAAEDGNAQLLIWLGKVILKQKEEHTDVNAAFQTISDWFHKGMAEKAAQTSPVNPPNDRS